MIEHNLDVIKTADHIIDLDQEGGVGGGNRPEEVAANPASYTGQYLKRKITMNQRISNLRNEMKAQNLKAVLINNLKNVYYLTTKQTEGSW